MRNVTITGLSGDMFDRCAVEIRDELAAFALADVHRILDSRIQHPTPYYETQVTSDVHGDERWVHDRGVVYGPWLEGTSRRNRRTRFKGYHAFTMAADMVWGRMKATTDRIVGKYTS
jgi:hypothetical protein